MAIGVDGDVLLVVADMTVDVSESPVTPRVVIGTIIDEPSSRNS